MNAQPQLVFSAAAALLNQFLKSDSDLDQAALRTRRELLTQSLRPRDADYAQVFVGSYGENARKGYEALWARSPGPVIDMQDAQSQVRIAVVQAAVLGTENKESFAFPGGYRDIAPFLIPDRYWVAWEFLAPGARAGLQYNGLVYLDARFVWFPKPWRVLTAS